MSEPVREIRVATVGTSVITEALTDAVARVPGIRIDAVYSRDAGRGAQYAERFGADWSSDSFDEVLASPLVDAVYIASPNSAHGAQVLQAIDAGKHVLVEKPAVTTADEWVSLVERARARGVVLLEAMRTEYDPGTALVRSLLPELGTLRSASLRNQRQSSRYQQVLAGEHTNMFDPALAGGALMDLGVYCIHAMLCLFGTPQGLSASSVRVASGVDGAGTIVARYPGLIVDLAYSKITSTQLWSEIQGEKATLVIDHISSPRAVDVVQLDGTAERHTIDARQHDLADEVARFVELISTGADASAEHARTEQTLRIIEQVRAEADVV